ncbi:MAG: stearoyl-CoA 9-desaturase [Thermoleophilia bacterium]|nr:stearoyl-CoA 9-desaturase [Thermoleophilia bacterium]
MHAEGRDIKGVRRLSRREALGHQVTVLVAMLLPIAALVVAVVLLWGHGFSAADLVAFLVMYTLSGLGMTVGFHRQLTHRSFETSPRMRACIAAFGSLAVEGGPIGWVAAHRRHHAFSDQPGDPHSPHVDHDHDDGVRAALAGLWHAHIGWMFRRELTEPERWASDLLADPLLVRVDRAFPLISAISLALPALIGFALTGTAFGAFTAFLWGGIVRVMALHHMTWSVNSICHTFGSRPWKSNDRSTNNWLLSIVSFGESWHNAHHAFPSSAVHGLGRFQVDVSALVIRGLERLGVARNVRVPSPSALERRANPGT